MSKSGTQKKAVNLALQGGGAHGAFAWGVLDKILEDGRLDIEGICATSAGTMNACAYAYGNTIGGAEKAREVLHDFWWNVHVAGEQYSPVQRMPWEEFMPGNNWNMDYSPAFFAFDTMTRMFSPYMLNPFDFNPLRDVLERTIDFNALRHCKDTKLFISTTHVQSGKVRVFYEHQMTIDIAMASACLPFLFKAVELDGEAYWDGGYMGNPVLYPLFYGTKSRDVMIVHINPIEREEVPKSAHDIMNRINEISFNSSLLQEMRAIAFVKKLIEYDMIKDEHKKDFKDVLVHSISADEAMKELSVASKFSSDWGFLTDLRDRGRATMEEWLDKNFDSVGVEDTVDLHSKFLYSVTKMFEGKHGDDGRRCVNPLQPKAM
ncbi:MAG: patatin-like phospholipase family protein [Alphaproteobacteria bacterium]